MPQIHPSSIVDRQAQLASDVEIGPGCVIEGPVQIGPGCRLIANVYLKGPLVLGSNNVVYPFACLGFDPQVRKFDIRKAVAGVKIGNDNVIRESVTIHGATGAHPTTIGNNNYLMVNCHLGHDVRMGNNCTLANGALLAGHVEMQDNVMMGGNAVVHQFCRLGRLSMQSGGTGVVQDIPPFCTAWDLRQVGLLNYVGLRRAGYRQHIRPLKKAFDLLYRGGHGNQVAVALIEKELGGDPLCLEFAAFIRSSKRGITPYCGARQHLPPADGVGSTEPEEAPDTITAGPV